MYSWRNDTAAYWFLQSNNRKTIETIGDRPQLLFLECHARLINRGLDFPHFL